MTRKSRKGVVGKALPTAHKRYKVGPGIDFVEDHLSYGDEIEIAVEKARNRKGL